MTETENSGYAESRPLEEKKPAKLTKDQMASLIAQGFNRAQRRHYEFLVRQNIPPAQALLIVRGK